MKTISVIDALLHQLVVLPFESPVFCWVSKEQRERFTRLTEILIGSVTFSIANSAEFVAFIAFAVFTACLTCIWFPGVNRAKRSVPIVSIVQNV